MSREYKKLWTASEIEKATRGKWVNPPANDWFVSGVSYRTNHIHKGDLFFTVGSDGWRSGRKDTSVDIPAIFDAGAIAVVSTQVPEKIQDDQPLIIVEDTLIAFRDLSRFARNRFKGKVICVTGSAGKTTTARALNYVLGRQFSCWLEHGATNNRFGVMQGLASTPPEYDFSLCEFGLFRPGDLNRMSMLAIPDIAVVTTIHGAHRGNFRSIEHIAESKAEIISGMDNEGIMILNHDSPFFERLCGYAKKSGIRNIQSFGSHAGADVRVVGLESDELSSRVTVHLNNVKTTFRIPFAGTHWLSGMLAVLCTVEVAGGNIAQAIWDLENFKLPDGRGGRSIIPLRNGSFVLLDDSYNATVASMRTGLALLGLTKPGPGGRRIAVLGDIAHLGAGSKAHHLKLAEPLLAAKVDRLFTVGDEMLYLRNAVPSNMQAVHAVTAQQLLPALRDELTSGDVVMIKGSFPSGVSELAHALRHGSMQ